MTDQELADALVAAGIGTRLEPKDIFPTYLIPGETNQYHDIPAEFFVQDWSVAGACLGQMGSEDIEAHLDTGGMKPNFERLRDPRAICLAYVQGLK